MISYEKYKKLSQPLAEEVHDHLDEIIETLIERHSSECNDDQGICNCMCESVISKVLGSISAKLLIASSTHCSEPVDFSLQEDLKEKILANLQNSINQYNEWYGNRERTLH